MPREVIDILLTVCVIWLTVLLVALAVLFLAADEIHWTWGF